MDDDREDVAEQLRRVRDGARADARSARNRPAEPPPAPSLPPVTPSVRPGPQSVEEAPPPPPPPDAGPVNAAWRAEGETARGLLGPLRRLLERLLRPRFEAQRDFNSRQVQLDNEMLEYLEKRAAATHRHYDRLLGELGRRLDEADERHAILERELVGHVQDLVHRIDIVLTDGRRGRLGLEFALEEVRERLVRLEEVLRRPE